MRFTVRDLLWCTLAGGLGVLLWLSLRRDWFSPAPLSLDQAYPAITQHFSTTLRDPYVVEVTDEAIGAAPRWDRRFHDPPLSARDAIALADAARKRLIKEGKVREDSADPYWVFARGELTPHDLSRGLWYWVVQFDTGLGKSGPPWELRLVVLMNGVVVEPSKDVYKVPEN